MSSKRIAWVNGFTQGGQVKTLRLEKAPWLLRRSSFKAIIEANMPRYVSTNRIAIILHALWSHKEILKNGRCSSPIPMERLRIPPEVHLLPRFRPAVSKHTPQHGAS